MKKNNPYAYIELALALFLALCGVLSLACGIYQLAFNGAVYGHIFIIGALYLSFSGLVGKEVAK